MNELGRLDAELRRRLVTTLEDIHALRSQEWSHAFLTVPRHLFIPRFRLQSADTWLDESDPGQHDRWIETAYRNVVAIIKTNGAGWYTSSSSMPSIMAQMLEMLAVDDSATVLEIGTGSGYNAALLCERLGSANVVSVDIDPQLVGAASERLARCGYAPMLAVRDGSLGYPDRAPYDRLIATCSAWPIPVAWIQQVRPRGRIVTVVPHGCVWLEAQEDGSACGRFHRDALRFMPLRTASLPTVYDFESIALGTRSPKGAPRAYKHLPGILEAGGYQESFLVLVSAVAAPHLYHFSNDEQEPIVGDATDHSWARLDWRRDLVFQGGPRRIWDQIECLYDDWCRLGAPNRERFGLRVEPDGRHVLWLDSHDSGHTWEARTNWTGVRGQRAT